MGLVWGVSAVLAPPARLINSYVAGSLVAVGRTTAGGILELVPDLAGKRSAPSFSAPGYSSSGTWNHHAVVPDLLMQDQVPMRNGQTVSVGDIA